MAAVQNFSQHTLCTRPHLQNKSLYVYHLCMKTKSIQKEAKKWLLWFIIPELYKTKYAQII